MHSKVTKSLWQKKEMCILSAQPWCWNTHGRCPSSQPAGRIWPCWLTWFQSQERALVTSPSCFPVQTEGTELCKGTQMLEGRNGSTLKNTTIANYSTSDFYQTIIYPGESRVLHLSNKKKIFLLFRCLQSHWDHSYQARSVKLNIYICCLAGIQSQC